MILVLDTNVISELIRPSPEPSVLAWMDAQHRADVTITAITVGELAYGLARLPAGQRKVRLGALLDSMLDEEFYERVHPYDTAAATAYGSIVANRDRAGHPISPADGQIAAICQSRGATLATRNGRDFRDVPLDLVDPWAR